MKKFTIAFITDDIVFSNLIVIPLKRELPDLRIILCKSLAEINEQINSQLCNLILLDGGFGSVSSIEIIEYLRKEKRITSPIWFFPEILTNEYSHKSILMGANKLFYKPFDPSFIVNELTNTAKNKPLNVN